MSAEQKTFHIRRSSHGLVDVPGFKAAGVHCDVRNKADGRLDLALILSEVPCSVAGTFTTNAFAAAPVLLCQAVVKKQIPVRALVINSGNANACTGKQGMDDAFAMQDSVAKISKIERDEVLVCSTGRIGEPLPMDRIHSGIELAAGVLSEKAVDGQAAADAILTSDTRRKVASVSIVTDAGKIHLSAMAKGAGMIEPNMATMLGFIVTDAGITSKNFQNLLSEAVQGSFNAITVDGDMSTNDTVLALANGVSGIRVSPRNQETWLAFTDALNYLCREMAAKIVGDGEKITKVVEISVREAKSRHDAEAVARAIGNSLLVKSSWYGNDPNWGRILDAAGYAGVQLIPGLVHLAYQATPSSREVPVYGEETVFKKNKTSWKRIVSRKSFRIILTLGLGTHGFNLLASDLTEGYVNFNKSE